MFRIACSKCVGPLSRGASPANCVPSLTAAFSTLQGQHHGEATAVTASPRGLARPQSLLLPAPSRINVQSQRWYMRKKTVKRPPTKELKFDYSGDLVTTLEPVDLKQPKPGYEDVEELKIADEDIRKIYSLEFGDARDLLQHRLDEILSVVKEHPADLQSLEVKITTLTVRIRNHIRHALQFRKDKFSKARLIERIQLRRSYLGRLQEWDEEKFDWLTEMLQLRHIPVPEDNRKPSKREVRIQAARDHARNVKHDKIKQLTQQFEQEKETFLMEKEKELAKIVSEMKELGLDCKFESPEEVYEALGLTHIYAPPKEYPTSRRRKLLQMKFELYAHRRYSKIDVPS